MKYKLNQTGMAHIAILGFIVIVIGAVGFAGYRVLQSDEKSPLDEQSSRTILKIESEPAGISITGDPSCDSAELNSTTPYECEINDGSTETVLTAPAEVEKDGKKYSFGTWDGCSESNEDKTVCKVLAHEHQTTNLTANYTAETVPQSNNSPANNQNNPCANPSSDNTYFSCTIKDISELPKKVHVKFKYSQEPHPYGALPQFDISCVPRTACEHRAGQFNENTYEVLQRADFVLLAPRLVITYHCGIGCVSSSNHEKFQFKRFTTILTPGADFTIQAEYDFACNYSDGPTRCSN